MCVEARAGIQIPPTGMLRLMLGYIPVRFPIILHWRKMTRFPVMPHAWRDYCKALGDLCPRSLPPALRLTSTSSSDKCYNNFSGDKILSP